MIYFDLRKLEGDCELCFFFCGSSKDNVEIYVTDNFIKEFVVDLIESLIELQFNL